MLSSETGSGGRDRRAAAVREQVLDGVAAVLEAGEELTYARAAAAAGVPERTVYRYFPNRSALLAAVYAWSNDRIGFDGALPSTGAEAAALARRVFPGFDEIAAVVEELLVSPEGLTARRQRIDERRAAMVELVRKEAPGLREDDMRRTAAAVQLLTSAAAWRTLRDFWDVDGAEAGETAALAIELLLAGARRRGAAANPDTEESDR